MANSRMIGIGTPNSHNKIPRPMIASSSMNTQRLTPTDLAGFDRATSRIALGKCRPDPNSTRGIYRRAAHTQLESDISDSNTVEASLDRLKELVHCTAFEATPSRILGCRETLRMKSFRDGRGSLGARVPVTIDVGLSERGLRIAKRVLYVG
jgi:hypothetical protein